MTFSGFFSWVAVVFVREVAAMTLEPRPEKHHKLHIINSTLNPLSCLAPNQIRCELVCFGFSKTTCQQGHFIF